MREPTGGTPPLIVLRANEGDCLEITFTNYLNPSPPDNSTATRKASIHVNGLDYVGSMENAATVISRMHRGEKRLVKLLGRVVEVTDLDSGQVHAGKLLHDSFRDDPRAAERFGREARLVAG